MDGDRSIRTGIAILERVCGEGYRKESGLELSTRRSCRAVSSNGPCEAASSRSRPLPARACPICAASWRAAVGRWLPTSWKAAKKRPPSVTPLGGHSGLPSTALCQRRGAKPHDARMFSGVNGNTRQRLPQAAKIALPMAGCTTAVPGSPNPPGTLSLLMK